MSAHTKQLFHYAHQNNTLQIQQCILKSPSYLDQQDDQGLTVLDWAMRFGNDPLIEWLVTKGADINASSDIGWTVLHWVAHRGNQQLLDHLCQWGADLNAQTARFETALHLAAKRGHYQSLRVLVAEGALLLSKNDQGLTASEVAREEGHLNCMRFLDRQVSQRAQCWQHLFDLAAKPKRHKPTQAVKRRQKPLADEHGSVATDPSAATRTSTNASTRYCVGTIAQMTEKFKEDHGSASRQADKRIHHTKGKHKRQTKEDPHLGEHALSRGGV